MVSKKKVLCCLPELVGTGPTQSLPGEVTSEKLNQPSYLPTQVDHVGVGVVEGQQHSVTGVNVLHGYGLLHVLLQKHRTRWR